jgi:hypothetical protein
MGALDVRCLNEIHTIRYLNYLLNISHDFIYIIGSRSIWKLGSSIVYWAGKEVVSRQGGRHLGLHNVGFQGFWFGKRGMVWKELIPKIEFLLRRHAPPKCVVIQLGSNDLGTVKGWQLAKKHNMRHSSYTRLNAKYAYCMVRYIAKTILAQCQQWQIY